MFVEYYFTLLVLFFFSMRLCHYSKTLGNLPFPSFVLTFLLVLLLLSLVAMVLLLFLVLLLQ